ncbi:MAG TPA: PIN domain-containing protein [Polyangiaceae bacterium]|nr:PIN domain-containing protein [Polyangiaceae bacterium]
MKAIADTGFLVALASERDMHHPWAASIADLVTEPLLTCEAVLAETAFHLRDAAGVLDMVLSGLVTLAFDAGSQAAELYALATRYANRRPDFADLCLVRMSELHPRHTVITIDRKDFTIYRRHRNQPIPLICP